MQSHVYSVRPFFSSVRTVAAIIALSSIVGSGQSHAQTPKLTYQDLSLETKDNWELKITYYKSPAGQEAPVVILLHGKTGNRLVWKSFAEVLQDKLQFAVITVDLRGHGESTGSGGSGKKNEPKKSDYVGMIEGDMEAIKKFLYEENQNKNLNMNKLGIVASDISTAVAIAYTEVDWSKTPYDDAVVPELQTPRGQDVQVLCLLSPELNAPGIPVTKSLQFVRGIQRPVLICVGAKNNPDLKEAKKANEVLATKADTGTQKNAETSPRLLFKQYPVKLHGTDLLTKDLSTEEDLFNFLHDHLKKARGQWRDRKSKLD